MKPQILSVYTPEGKPHAFLVDADSVFIKTEDGKQRTHYATAIDLRECTTAEIALAQPDEKGSMRILAPHACVLAIRKSMKTVGLASRHLDPKAAEVMLRLAASAQNVQVPFNGSMTWTFGEPIRRTKDSDVMANTTPEKLIAAWKWSHWQRHGMSGAQQHADMRSIGYSGSIGAFYEMMETIGLSVTKAR
jgi:hypothetical protein